MPEVPKTISLQCLYNNSRKTWRMKFIFCLLINVEGFSNWYYHFRCLWPNMPILPKITILLLLYNLLKKKWVMQSIFYMQISMKACWKLIPRFFDGYGQAFLKFQKKQVCSVFTIFLKTLQIKLTFLTQINIEVY